MKKVLNAVVSSLRAPLAYAMIVVAFLFVFAAMSVTAFATGDPIADTVTSLSGYWTTVEALAIGVVLFVIGRRILRKI